MIECPCGGDLSLGFWLCLSASAADSLYGWRAVNAGIINLGSYEAVFGTDTRAALRLRRNQVRVDPTAPDMKSIPEFRISSTRVNSRSKSSSARPGSLAIAKIKAGGGRGGRFRSNHNGSRARGLHRRSACLPVSREESQPSHSTILRIVNKIFRTGCKDTDAIDATATWGVILEEIKPYDDVVPILALQFQMGMTLREAVRILRLPLHRAAKRYQRAMDKLRHPCHITRIRDSIMGWPNLYRDV